MAKSFILDGRYGDLLQFYGIRVEEVLRKAQLPGDAFKHRAPTMTEAQYYRFMDAAGSLITDPEVPIKMACMNKIESFSPPIFASYCSKNARVCIQRLASYKRLIGPMVFNVSETDRELTVELTTGDAKNKLPQFVVETEFSFLVGIIRRALKEDINPVRVTMTNPVSGDVFNDFLGVKVVTESNNSITFLKEDLEKPFISYDEAMWSYFEPELTKRLAELDVDDSVGARVRSALTELMPGGACGIEDVAAKLGLSRRTLQRKLSEEDTTFQKQLNNTREILSIHYIRNTDMTTNDIAFILGYQELNSFLRAFTIWTGKSISEYKKSIACMKN